MKYTESVAFLSQHAEVFRDFSDREERLDQVVRYHTIEVKRYPTTLRSHQHQVAAYAAHVLESCGNSLTKTVDARKVLVMAWIHDDLEMFMKYGDIPSSGEAQRKEEVEKMIKDDESYGIQNAGRYFPTKVAGYVYEELLRDAGSTLDSLEAQFVKFCDKMSGLAEALHEINRGNTHFLQRPYDEMIDQFAPAPKEYYARYTHDISSRLPLLYHAFGEQNIPLLDPIEKESDYEQRYGFWKEALRRYAPTWELQRLEIES